MEVPDEFKGPMEDIEKPSRVPEIEKAPTSIKKRDDLKEQEISKAAEAEAERITRCEKMMASANIYPEDKKELQILIITGITPSDFTQEVIKAIENKKKKEAEKELSSEEKATLLEEELAAELAELEEELIDDEDDDDLEEKILQEIEDLENL